MQGLSTKYTTLQYQVKINAVFSPTDILNNPIVKICLREGLQVCHHDPLLFQCYLSLHQQLHLLDFVLSSPEIRICSSTLTDKK